MAINNKMLAYSLNAQFLSGIEGPPVFSKSLPDSSEIYDWATFYVSQGLSVIPLTTREKKPLRPWSEYQKRIATAAELKEWFPLGTKLNIGIVTGELSGVNVIDFDTIEAYKEAMDREAVFAPLVKTAKGFHLFCKATPGANNFHSRSDLKKVDFRGEGGYVVAPPSVHPSGVQYQWVQASDCLTPPKLPSWVLDGPQKGKSQTQQLLDGVSEGGRNNALASLAGQWFRDRKTFNDVLILANGWNLKNHPPMEETEVERTVRSILKRHEAEQGGATKAIAHGPLPLRRPLPPPAEFPLDALPPVIRDAVNLVVDFVQVPPALAGQSALAAATLAMQGLSNVGIDGRIYPTSNFFVTIAESGERKSAVDRLFLVPHHEHQRSLATLAASQRTDFNIAHTAWKCRRDAYVKKNKDAALFDSSVFLKKIGQEPVPPRNPLFLVEEPTYEGLIKLLETGQPSVGLFSDEGGRFVGGHGMNKDNVLKTIAGLSKLWDGDPITRSRSGDGHIVLYDRRCSMHLMIQPQIMPSLFGQGLLAGQGFLSRVLCVYPSSTIGARHYREENISSRPEFSKYTETLGALLNNPLPISMDDPAMGLQLPTMTLATKAKQEWIQFHDRVESGIRDGQAFSTIRGFAAKAAEHVLRVSAVFSLIEDPRCNTVNHPAMTQAVKLVDYYLMEALRLFGQGHDSPDLELAEKCLLWCQKQEGGVFELARLYQQGPSPVRSKNKAMQIIQILTDHGWIQEVEGGLTIEGQHHSQAWRVINYTPC